MKMRKAILAMLVVGVTSFAGLMVGDGLVWGHQTDRSSHITEVRPAASPSETAEVEQLLSISIEDLAHHLELVPHGVFPSPQMLDEKKGEFSNYIDSKTVVRADEIDCELRETEFVAYPGSDGRVHYHQLWDCPYGTQTLTLENRVMHDTPGGYRHFGRVQLEEDIFATVFDPLYPTYSVYLDSLAEEEEEVEREGTFLRFLWQGFLHIILGFDHILFVLVLLFAVRRFRNLVFVITAFTAGHSVTLALSALDIFTIADRVIEPLIALSIAYVAVQNILRSGKWRHVWTTALFFGLIHGFGFSYILRDEMELPAQAALSALFAFNVGVELGQLLVVLLVFPLVIWLRRNREKFFLGVNRWVNAGVLLVAGYWMVERLFFW